MNIKSPFYDIWGGLLITSLSGYCQNYEDANFSISSTGNTFNSKSEGVIDIPSSSRSWIMVLTCEEILRRN